MVLKYSLRQRIQILNKFELSSCKSLLKIDKAYTGSLFFPISVRALKSVLYSFHFTLWSNNGFFASNSLNTLLTLTSGRDCKKKPLKRQWNPKAQNKISTQYSSKNLYHRIVKNNLSDACAKKKNRYHRLSSHLTGQFFSTGWKIWTDTSIFSLCSHATSKA